MIRVKDEQRINENKENNIRHEAALGNFENILADLLQFESARD
jgi:hypothetical protein